MNNKIAYITDIHLDEQFPIDQGVNRRINWKTILKDISSKKIDKVIFGGDIGEKSSNQWFFESLENYNISISLGNHDYFSEVIKYYSNGVDKKQNELYYSEESTFYKCIFLDSSSGSISQNQIDWLKKELTINKKIIIFIHHPILAVDSEVDRRFSLKERKK